MTALDVPRAPQHGVALLPLETSPSGKIGGRRVRLLDCLKWS